MKDKEINLGEFDTALIIRQDGGTEILLPKKEDFKPEEILNGLEQIEKLRSIFLELKKEMLK